MTEQRPSKTVLMTGAAGGLGRALAHALAAEGAQLVLLDRDARGLERLCDEVEVAGAPAPGSCPTDLARIGPAECQELVDGVNDAYGGLDVLIHCAARFDGLQPLDQVGGDVWLEHVQTNLNAPWLLTRTCLPALRSARGAVVFAINEAAGAGGAYWGPYGICQASLRCMVSTLAEELGGSGCRVYGFDPGPMRTALRARGYHAEDPSSVPNPENAAARIVDLVLEEGASQGPVFRGMR